MNNKGIIVLLLACIIQFSCKEKNTKTNNDKLYQVDQAVFPAPSGNLWHVSDSGENKFTFAYSLETDSLRATIEAGKIFINEHVDTASIFKYTEDSLIHYYLRYKPISPHYYRKVYKGKECLEYDGIYEDTASLTGSPPILSVRGLFMQDAINPRKIYYFKLTHTSFQKKILPAILTSYQEFIERTKVE